MSPWLYVLASILGGSIVSISTLAGIRLGQGAEDRRLALAERQRLRDVKAERLRHLYEPLLKFGLLLTQIVHEKGFGMADESQEERDQRHEQEMSVGINEVSQVIAAAIMEPGTRTVLSAYDGAYRACDSHLRSWRMIKAGQQPANSSSYRKEIAEVTTTSAALVLAVQTQLTDLETPLLLPARKWWQLT